MTNGAPSPTGAEFGPPITIPTPETLEAPMTEDEQEALSCKYVMQRCMRLASGRFAIIIGDDLRIVESLDAVALTYEELPELKIRQATPVRKQHLNLADLGL